MAAVSLDIPDAYERAIEKMPFSNSDDGYGWIDNNCARCVHDGCGVDGNEPFCPLLTVAFIGRTPAEWMLQPPGSPDRYHCIMFRDRDDPGGFEPEPIPDPPGQEFMWPREPFEGARMWATAHLAAELAGTR